MSTEVEIKVKIPDEDLIARIQRDDNVTRFIREDFSVDKMHTVYYDTPDWDLCRNGFMLRIRSNGVHMVASLKHGSVDKTVHPGRCIRSKWICTSTEIGSAIESLMNAGAPDLFYEITKGKPIVESCHADFTRTSNILYLPEGLRVEMAMDHGTMYAGNNSAPILEMELEILFGTVGSLLPFVDSLSETYGLTPELHTKYERAYALVKPL